MEETNKYVILNQILVFLVTSKDYKIMNILTQIRALKGVVTISVVDPTRTLSHNEHFTKLSLKFLGASKGIAESLKMLKRSIQNIDGVNNVIIKIKTSDLRNLGVNNVTTQTPPMAPNSGNIIKQ